MATATAGAAANGELFHGVSFYLNDSLLPSVRAQLHDLLVASGAEPCPPAPTAANAAAAGVEAGAAPSPSKKARSPPRFDPARLTHFITDSLDFAEFDLIQELNGREVAHDKKGKGKSKEGHAGGALNNSTEDKVHIVTPAWATRSYDLQTLQPPRFYSADKKLFFSGTVICTSELPTSDTRDIHQAVLTLGGQTRRELTREVTHLICMSESGRKYQSAMKYGAELGMQVVLPHWFEESFKHSMLVPTDVYRFPSPPFSTSLRDDTSSKPFADRLFDYWRTRLSSTNSGGASTSTSAAAAASPLPQAVPNTSTYLILGIPGKGGAMPTGGADRPIDAQQYLQTTGAFAQAKRTATVLDAASLPVPPNEPVDTSSYGRFFAGKRIYLASDLSLSLGFEGGLRAQVARAGGSCWSFQYGDGDFPGDDDDEDANEADDKDPAKANAAVVGKLRSRRSATSQGADAWETRRRAEKRLKESDIVIMQVREGWEFWTAYENSLSIGNLQYFYDCMAHSTLLSPLARLCYYPVPSVTGLPDWPQRDRGTPPVMTVSNYAAEARDYVRTLIELLGARFEGTMTKSTDYVVSATENGSKVSHAREWHIPLVTHFWLEALILDWRYVPPTADPSYLLTSSSSHGTHYAAILGDTPYTRDVIRRWTQREDVKAARNEAMRPIEELAKADEMPDIVAEDEVLEDAAAMEVEQAAPAAPEPRISPPAPDKATVPRPATSKAETVARRSKSRTETPQAAEPEHEAAAADVPEKGAAVVTPNKRNGKVPLAGKRKRERSQSTLSSAASSSSSDEEDLSPSPNKMNKAYAQISGENLVQGGSRRGAAAKAQAALVDQIKDRNAFEKELKSSGRKKGGGVRRSRSPSKKMTQDEDEVKDEEMSDGGGGDEQDEPEPPVAVKKARGKSATKSKAAAARAAPASDAEEPVRDAPPARKKAKTAKAPPANKQLKTVQASGNGTTQDGGVVSSFDRPPNAKPVKKTDKPKKVKIISTGLGLDRDHDDIKSLKLFGAAWTDNSKDATHLVVKGISRTEKFLCSLPYSPKIVTPGWISACIAAGKLVDETPYLLKDVKKEKEIGDTLEAILERARQRKLFDGYNIYVTKHIQPDTSVMQRIITACGGTVHTKDLSKFSKKVLEDPQALVVSCVQDRREWQSLAAAPHHRKIYSVEAILQATLHQDIKRGFTDNTRIDARWDE